MLSSKHRPIFTWLTLASVVWIAAGCATGPAHRADTAAWPDVNTIDDQPPSDLEVDAPTALLRQGSDGYLYAVGLTRDVQPGETFVARYSGKWPLGEMPRPPLAAGRVVATYPDQGAARVHLTYVLPRTEAQGLELTWEESLEDVSIGKGLATITSTRAKAPDGPWSVELKRGTNGGLSEGDVYGILAPPADTPEGAARRMQLTRRLVGLCTVRSVDDDIAHCKGHPMGLDNEAAPRPPTETDTAVFLEHRMIKEPREAVIQIALSDGTDPGIQKRLAGIFKSSVEGHPKARTDVETLDVRLDAQREDFHQVQDTVGYGGGPQAVVAAKTVERDGQTHLVLNYTGIGPAVGPGMVAAPPTGGVDLGPVRRVHDDTLKAYAEMVYGAILVYRGQTHLALSHLYGLLENRALYGPMRWHTRDQFAMRWGAYGHYREALWLVDEDEAVARADDHRLARLNAFGTKVRLFDFVGLKDRAIEAARAYLDDYESESDSAAYVGALGMLAEMQMKAGHYEAGRKTVARLRKRCPEGCGGDLFSYLSGIWWAVPADAPKDTREELLSRMTTLAEDTRDHRLAAARLYQGVEFLSEDELDQAYIAFQESERLYEKAKMLVGRARAQFFLLITQTARKEYQKAFEAGRAALNYRRELRDYEGVATTYFRMTGIYSNLDLSKRPGPFIGYARGTLTAATEAQRARGDLSRTAESLFTTGSLLFRFGSDDATRKLQASVAFAVQSTRFDIAAMAHLYLAMQARRNQDREGFREEIHRAQTMAELSDDPRVKEAIEKVLNPPKEKEDVPSQLL
jgi:hypothetical protein